MVGQGVKEQVELSQVLTSETRISHSAEHRMVMTLTFCCSKLLFWLSRRISRQFRSAIKDWLMLPGGR